MRTMHRVTAITLFLSVAAFAATTTDAAAQKLSERPITIIVPTRLGPGPTSSRA